MKVINEESNRDTSLMRVTTLLFVHELMVELD